MKCLIVGTGQMGRCIAYAMNKLGYEVHTADATPWIGCPSYVKSHQIIITPKLVKLEESSIVISALPFYLNADLAELCVKTKTPYCDLGGDIVSTKKIEELAKKEKSVVMTDLGLAPGWINILAYEGLSKVKDATKVELAVGGITKNDFRLINPLSYKITWSVDGLINEYKKDCFVLEDGEVVLKPPLKGYGLLTLVDEKNYIELEGFYTSGGTTERFLNDLKNVGVKDASYRTLRWPGHCALVNWLLKSEIDKETFQRLLENDMPDNVSDVVVLSCDVSNDDGLRWNAVKYVHSDMFFTAMQRATAFPCAVAADVIAKSTSHTNVNNDVVTYKDIPFEYFNNKVEELFNGEGND